MRRLDRQITDLNEISDILNKAKIMHMAMVENGFPYVLPLNFGYEFENGVLALYFHSANEGRKINILRDNPLVFCEIDMEGALLGQGSNACVYGYAFASVMGPGKVSFLESHEEKMHALDIIMKHQTGRDGFEYKGGFTNVAVCKVTLESFSAKANRGE